VRSPSSSEGRARSTATTTGWRRLLCALALALGAASVATGCGHLGVKAHQRELLADRIMRFDADPQERAADEHVLSNREGAIGGTGTSGGGCGCN
jgi:Domain of unknown function (DUF4266)